MKRTMNKALAVVMAVVLAVSVSACGKKAEKTDIPKEENSKTEELTAVTNELTGGSSIINIGVTDTLGTLNPLNMDYAFINLYATSLMFLPLGGLNDKMEFEGFIADSITTQDNKVFTVKLKDEAKWSDGEDVTADDVIFTILRLTCPEVANYSFDFSMFEGFSDDGSSPSGAESIAGVEKIDDKTLRFELKGHMNLNTFINNVATWICILPSHALKDIPAGELLSSDWFNHPTVTDGPFVIEDYDPAHYISYSANDSYFLGRPKADKLNFKVVQGSELLAGLKTGEIDFVHPSISAIPVEDRPEIEALPGIKARYSEAVTNEMTFINTKNIPDRDVRRAMVYAIDRQTLLNSLLGGNGEISEGVLPSASPYYDPSGEKTAFDPQKAKELLSKAGWDSTRTLKYYVGSNDEVAVRAAQVVEQNLEAVGIDVDLRTVDFATLMSVAGTDDVDMFSVQYTITPNDYYADMLTLVDVNGESWSGGFFNPELDRVLKATQEAGDDAELKKLYAQMNSIIIDETPLFSLYFISNLGAVSERIANAEPVLYGAFNNIHEWDVR